MKTNGLNDKRQMTNPIDESNILSRIFFSWLLPYFVEGYQRELTEDDMYQHRKNHDSGKLGRKLEAAWHYQVTHKKNPSLFRAMCSTFLPEIILLWGVNFVLEIPRVAQPLLIAKLLTFYDNNSVNENNTSIFLYAGLLVSTSLFYVLAQHSYLLQIMQVEIKMRVAACSLVYRKSLKLNKRALVETTIGQMVNLISNDVSRFDRVLHMIQMLILGPLETVVIMVFCYRSIGYTGLIGMILLLIAVPFQSWFGNLTSQYRLKTAIQTDERVRLINEIISGIQVIKMYAWEKPFSKMVELARRNEMVFIQNTTIIRAILIASGPILKYLGAFLCILVYVQTGNHLNASYVYSMTSFYKFLDNITICIPLGVSLASEMLISIRRIETFLMYDEVDSATADIEEVKQVSLETSLQMQKNETEIGVYINKASVKWLDPSPENILEDVTIKVTTSELVALVGTVGSGKTTLLNMILGELKPHSGRVMVKGTVSYSSQEPWLFSDSIRQNILFGQPFIQDKYVEVVRVCALEEDFQLLIHGDETLIGERGLKLSGGQRARINLARSIYRDADIYLLDDPLSAVDTYVGKHVFEECIRGYLKGKCVILVTHQLQYLKNIINIYLLANGKVRLSGSYDINSNANMKFLKMMSNNDEIGRKNNSITTREQVNYYDGNKNGKQFLNREEKCKGNISGHVYKSYVKAGGSSWKIYFLAFACLSCQSLQNGSDYFVTLWVNTCQRKNQFHPPSKNVADISQNINTTVSSNDYDSDDIWWATSIFTGDETIIYYSLLIAVIIIMILLRNLAFYEWCLSASTNMHYMMFDKIIHSPMRFFQANSPGRILNRFSKDTGVLDESIPTILGDTIGIGLTVIATTLMIGSLSAWVLLPTVAIFVLLCWIRVVFLRTSRDVARVQSVTRSPIYTHIATTLQGITTIRAQKVQDMLMKKFDEYQNLNSAAVFMYLSISRTLGFWLDLLSVFYFAYVVVAMLFINNETFGGNVGLALTQAMSLTGIFQYGVRQWCEMENQMTSVERIQEYIDLNPEKDTEVKDVSESWPEKGNIEFKNLSLRYAPGDTFVLRNVSFTIGDKEKIGIVGRTGAGKSSLAQALFRLANFEGNILIDDVNTQTVRLEKLRSKISIIPQEPVLFSGTLRRNLDPFREFSDEEIWNSLNSVEMGSAVAGLHSGLDFKIAGGGSNFSVGQRQLLCLARTILRNNRILVLDEATANVDPQTDALIQKTIKKKFATCTVVTIAHRLHTIMDSDRVLVMDAGQVAEFDHPHILFQNAGGIFHSLVMHTGASDARNLMTIAEEKYKQKLLDCKSAFRKE